jgi:anti-sigma regulatory factor (Ser/Thr protein kinase)
MTSTVRVGDGRRADDSDSCTTTVSLDLAATLTAPRTARRYARAFLDERGVEKADIENVEMIVTELVTNATLHQRPTRDAHHSDLVGASDLRLTLLLAGDEVVVGVMDQNPDLPRKRCACAGDEDGRGLLIVEALSSSWGIERIHVRGKCVGKVVRAVIRCNMKKADCIRE